MRIMLDPGHTGVTDPGAVSGGLREADVNLDVALRLYRRLSDVPGLEIGLTRDRHVDLAPPGIPKDKFQLYDLSARTDMANHWPVDFFLSLHCNAASSESAHGYETFVHLNASAEARRVGQIIHKHLAPLFRADRGLKTADFHVLRETKMPAVLVEMGFVTNPEDRAMLQTQDFRERLSESLYTAILEAYPSLGNTPAPPGTPILGEPKATVEQAQAWARAKGASQWFIDLAPKFWAEADKLRRELVAKHGSAAKAPRPDGAYAQSAKETNFGRFGGVIPGPEWHNTCGLKTTSGGANSDPTAHAKFPSDEVGIRAHLDHLALYAGALGYPAQNTPDPRHFVSIRGVAPTFEELGGKWAPNPDYGKSIVRDYLELMLATKVPEPLPPVDWQSRALTAEAEVKRLRDGLRALIE